VELDPDFVAILGIDDGSYHVFLAPEGDTTGLYVSNRDARAFTVREQQNGTGSLAFSYRIVRKHSHRPVERFARLEEDPELKKPLPLEPIKSLEIQSEPGSDRPDSST
jgi:hypothetical protein